MRSICAIRTNMDGLQDPAIMRQNTRERRLAAMRLQEIEGNPLRADQVEMFEMFERLNWTHEQRRAHILAKTKPLAAE